MKNDQTTEVKYQVTFGPKKESERETKNFTDPTLAIDFFKEKDKAGFHVDAYEITTVITKKKLS